MSLRLQIGGLFLLTAPCLVCQSKEAKPAPKSSPAPTQVQAKPGQPVPGNPKTAPPPRITNPLTPAYRFLNMTPEEQERVMEKATPQQQRQLQAALDRFNGMPQAQRARVMRLYQSLARLSPLQQAVVAKQIAAFNHLPEDRIKPVRDELLLLLRMTPDQRSTRFASEDFSDGYSPEEGQILKDLSNNLPPDYPLGVR